LLPSQFFALPGVDDTGLGPGRKWRVPVIKVSRRTVFGGATVAAAAVIVPSVAEFGRNGRLPVRTCLGRYAGNDDPQDLNELGSFPH
jgi:hypothetical protein